MTTELPELPRPMASPVGWPSEGGAFTASQMQEYATKAVLAERERCARIAENIEAGDGSHDYNAGAETMQERIAAAIRRGTTRGE